MAGGLLLALLATPAAAGEILEQRVWHEAGYYRIHLEARLAAPAERIRALLTDYNHLPRLSDSITASTLLAADPPRFTVEVLSQGCLGIFCRNLRQVQVVTERPDGYLFVEDRAGDFRSARTVWRIRDDGAGHSHVLYSAEFEPDFWIPPLFGPLLLRQRLAREARQLFDNLERLAGAHARP